MISKFAVSLGLLVSVVGLWSSPAGAHAELKQTEPDSAAVLDRAPTEVALHFTESVDIAPDSIRVFNSDAKRVDSDRIAHKGGNGAVVQAPLRPVSSGTYVVTWRVASVDSHPIHGEFTFQVGANATPEATALTDRLLNASDGNALTGAAFATVRFIELLALVIGVGALGFIAFVSSAATRAWVLARRSLILLAAVSALGLLVQGVYASGLTLAQILDSDLLSETLSSRYGIAAAARILICVALVALLYAVKPRLIATRVASGLGIVLISTVSMAGHASTGRLVPLALGLDVIHVSAGALWIGGLVVLCAVVFRQRGDLHAGHEVVTKFSAVALWCVVAITVTGSIQGWRQLGTLEALVQTDYGRLLVIKVAVFAGLIALAWRSRSALQRRADQGLRRSVAIEVGLAVVVIMVTSLLVNAIPAPSVSSEPFAAELHAGSNVLIDATCRGTRPGD